MSAFPHTLHIQLTTNDESIKEKYEVAVATKTTDSGFDLFMPADSIIEAGQTTLVDLGVRCEPQFEGGYYLYPRSSIGKTPLRLANSVGIIDSGYRGRISAWVHNTSATDYIIKKGERFFQLCHPSLMSMTVRVVDDINMNTVRGEGGFGSTGK
jgi:dUTP pyrophosphatase